MARSGQPVGIFSALSFLLPKSCRGLHAGRAEPVPKGGASPADAEAAVTASCSDLPPPPPHRAPSAVCRLALNISVLKSLNCTSRGMKSRQSSQYNCTVRFRGTGENGGLRIPELRIFSLDSGFKNEDAFGSERLMTCPRPHALPLVPPGISRAQLSAPLALWWCFIPCPLSCSDCIFSRMPLVRVLPLSVSVSGRRGVYHNHGG